MNVGLDRIIARLKGRSSLRRAREVCGVRLHEVDYDAGLHVPCHWHDWTSLHLVIRGCVADRFRRYERRATTGQLLHYPAGEVHQTGFGPLPARKFHIALPPGVEPRVPPGWPREPIIAWQQLAHALYGEFTRSDVVTELGLEGVISELIGYDDQRRTARAVPGWLPRARTLLLDSPGKTPSLTEMAHELGLHRSYLARAFHRWQGCTLGQYARRARIRNAAVTLSTSDAPLAQVAGEAEFADQSHFGREFRRQFGRTPGQFRGDFR